MTEVNTSLPNPAADRLLERYLDRVSAGWRLRILVPLSGDDVLGLLWPLMQSLRSVLTVPGTPSGETQVDRALETIADGAPLRFDNMTPEARATVGARLMVAMTGVAAGMLTPGPVMRLPQGLTADQSLCAVVLRSLYLAPLSIEGLQ